MLYLDRVHGDVWKITAQRAIQIFQDRKGSGILMADTAWLNGRHARFCGVQKATEYMAELWAGRESYPTVELVREDGTGYSGGHNTAAKLGWPIDVPEPKENALVRWDETVQGRFTNYQPCTASLVIV